MEDDDFLCRDKKTKYIDPHKLIPYDKNARLHGSELEFLKNSIRNNRFSEAQAIEVDKNMVIIRGHGRRLAAIALGMKKVPYVMRDDLSPAQVKEYRLADNKVSDLSGWDYDTLSDELDDLKELGVDMTEFGFEDFTQFEGPDVAGEDEEEDGTPLDDLKKGDGESGKVYRLMVICDDEADRLNLAEELAEKGYICQLI